MFSEENEEYMDSKKRLDSELPNSAKTDSWNAETKTVTRSVSTDGILYATEKIPTAEEEIKQSKRYLPRELLIHQLIELGIRGTEK